MIDTARLAAIARIVNADLPVPVKTPELKDASNLKSEYVRTTQHNKPTPQRQNNWKRGRRERPVNDSRGNAYGSVTEAAEAAGVTLAAIITAIKRQGKAGGRNWRYAT